MPVILLGCWLLPVSSWPWPCQLFVYGVRALSYDAYRKLSRVWDGSAEEQERSSQEQRRYDTWLQNMASQSAKVIEINRLMSVAVHMDRRIENFEWLA